MCSRELRLPGRRAAGFTLVELVITIVILGILAAVAAPILFGGFRVFSTSTADLHTLDKLRYATERMARELREVQHTAGAYALTLAAPTASSLSFTKNNGTTVTLNGTAPPLLTLSYSGVGTYTLTDQVAPGGVAFTGYALDGVTTTSDPAQIAYVELTLTLLRAPDNAGSFSQRTRVALRNQP